MWQLLAALAGVTVILYREVSGQALLLNPSIETKFYPDYPGSVAVHLQRNEYKASAPSYSQRSFRRADPCNPTPCGPNTYCAVQGSGNAVCRCNQGYFPKPNTIDGCGPQCTTDSECQSGFACKNTRCVDPCQGVRCGLNARCEVRGRRGVCECPPGFYGRPEDRCRENTDLTGRNPQTGPPAPPTSTNPCGPRACGPGTDCRVRSGRPVCSCLPGYRGDPISGCRQYSELCNPTPCGQNTNCKVQGERAVCSCLNNYIGNPLTGCRPECIYDSDCQSNQQCQSNKCRNACTDACGESAYCQARNHRVVCSCPEYYQGNPHTRCYPECTDNNHCGPRQACYNLRCANPCDGVCGSGADCEVRSTDRTPICSCPRGFTGDPFTRCYQQTPQDLCRPNPCGSGAVCNPGFDRSGQDRPVCTCPEGYIGDPLRACSRGDCITSVECPQTQACYGYYCTNPCLGSDGRSVCGTNALCNGRNHKAVCFCPDDHTGNPLTQCSLKPIARGRFKRFLEAVNILVDEE